MKIGLLSDTHGYLDSSIEKYFIDCDEVWHVGDFGPQVDDLLREKYKVRGVYGNIDDATCKLTNPEHQYFEIEGVSILMIHIGGYPERYSKKGRELIEKYNPKVFISGHSHICKVMRDPKHDLLHLNPGACGIHGFHKIKTVMRFEIVKGKVKNLQVVELGPRVSSAQ